MTEKRIRLNNGLEIPRLGLGTIGQTGDLIIFQPPGDLT